MSETRTFGNEPVRTVGVDLLRAVHNWSGRQYRLAMLRAELKKIGREMVAERKARERAGRKKFQKLKTGVRRLGIWRREAAKSQAM